MVSLKLEDITKLLKPTYFLAVAVATGLVLFLPQAVLQQIGLDGLRDSARPWLGGAFILSVALLVTTSAASLWTWVVSGRRVKAARRRQHEHLQNLTAEEKRILASFVASGTKTRELQINSGVVTGLMRKGILFLATGMGYSDIFRGPNTIWGDVNISDWAYNHLRSNQGLLR